MTTVAVGMITEPMITSFHGLKENECRLEVNTGFNYSFPTDTEWSLKHLTIFYRGNTESSVTGGGCLWGI